MSRYKLGWDNKYGGSHYYEDTKTGEQLTQFDVVKLLNEKDKELIEKFLKDIKAKWEYLTNHMYEMKLEPDFEKETENVFKDLKEKWEAMKDEQ